MKSPVIFIKILLAAVFLGGIVLWVDPARLKACMAHADGRYLFASIVLSFAMVAVSTWKWWYLLRLQGHPVPFVYLYRAYFVGYYYSNILPSNVGGDVARVWWSMQRGVPGAAGAAAVFAERFTGLLLLLLMAVISPFLSASLDRHPVLLGCAAVAAAGLIFLVFLMLGARPGTRLLETLSGKWTSRTGRGFRLLGRICAKAGTFGARAGALLSIIRRQPSAFWPVTGLTVLFYLLMLANVAVGFRVFGPWPECQTMAAVFPAALMVAMIPLSLGNIGITEGSYVFFFGLAGMGAEITLAMGLLLRAKIIMLGLIGLLAQIRKPGPAVATYDVGSADTEKY